ncbi:PREDICTED: uncharacterized protein LOC108578528 [Habropoda laboriosa]|nr:PREDICTED: uncharacterized protein LOC108578528 [Habropoda laboriosa]
MVLGLLAMANCQGSLLEMSQQLWTKLLTGGFAKAGKLDPLRVPVIKVDQSEGDTSYRIILRNMEIVGLNESTLDSIHIARGRLKSNLSDLEAGYVSYSDLRDLDSIRYRFHTLIKEPKTQNETFEAIVSATNRESKLVASPREQESQFERIRQYDPFLMKIQAEKMKEEPVDRAQNDHKLHHPAGFVSFNVEGPKVLSKSETTRIVENLRYPSDVQLIYAMGAMNSGLNSKNYEQKESQARSRLGLYAGQDRESGRQSQRRENFGNRRMEGRHEDIETSASENVESKAKDQRYVPGLISREQVYQGESKHMEKQPGYIDIVYADGSKNGGVKRFGNGRIESKENPRVFGVKDVSKDILESKRTISYNCTEGEALTKRNDAVKAGIEAKRLDGLTRYARDYQEKQGYFEEGMQLIYHYGGMDAKNPQDKLAQGTRHKRAHRGNETDDDVMHVIMKIRVPLLRVKSDYQLTGKVGKELVTGNGQLIGNFTELVGDFTIELTKTRGQDMLIVRAARSKLYAKNQKVSLEGMNEEGPLQSILGHGLMAAEAVAAMLADDLATKALNDKTADAMIYRMYKNLPVN